MKRAVQHPSERSTEEAGHEPGVRFLGPDERPTVPGLQRVDVDRLDPERRAGPGGSPRCVDVPDGRRDRRPAPPSSGTSDPSSKPPSKETDSTAGFQLGQRSISVRTAHTSSGAAATSISLDPTTRAPVSISTIASLRVNGARRRTCRNGVSGSCRTACRRELRPAGVSGNAHRGSKASGRTRSASRPSCPRSDRWRCPSREPTRFEPGPLVQRPLDDLPTGADCHSEHHRR